MTRGARVLLLVGVLGHMAAPSAQERRPETADPIGTVSGRVVDEDSGDAVRGARVTVVADGRARGTALTDTRGEFDVSVPGSGPASVRVAKAGFVSASAPVPGRATASPAARPFIVTLTPAGAVAGRVRDQAGNPASAIRVTVSRMTPGAGRSPSPDAATETDDRGEYRLGGLAPGQYVVRVYGRSGPVNGTASFVVSGNLRKAPTFLEAQALIEQAFAPRDQIVEVHPRNTTMLDHDGVEGNSGVTMTFEPRADGGVVLTRVVTPPSARASGGVVAGFVLDEYGDPVEGAMVELRPLMTGPARKTLGAGLAGRRTDDTGRYRLFGVPAGTYYLAALPPTDPTAGAPAGTQAEALATLAAMEKRQGTSPDGTLFYSQSTALAVAAAQRARSPVFYPGGALAGAVPLVVSNGQELSGLNLTLSPVPTVRVRGVVLDSSGRPGLAGSVSLAANLPWGVLGLTGLEAQIDPDGEFEIANVPPGDYVIQALGKASSEARELGVEPVSVGTSDPGPLTIVTSKGSRVTGRVSLAGSGLGPKPSLGLNVAPADGAYAAMLSVYTGGFVEPDGTFEISGLVGSGRFALTGAPEGWWLQSVTVDGRDVTDEAVVFGTRDYAGVEVVIGVDSGRIEGAVLLADDQSLPGPEQALALGMPPGVVADLRSPYAIAVFPVDAGRWFYRSRYLRLGSAGLNGRFAVSGLPPGDYWVAATRTAFGEKAYAAWQDPEFLTPLLPAAQRVRVVPGEVVEVALRPALQVR